MRATCGRRSTLLRIEHNRGLLTFPEMIKRCPRAARLLSGVGSSNSGFRTNRSTTSTRSRAFSAATASGRPTTVAAISMGRLRLAEPARGSPAFIASFHWNALVCESSTLSGHTLLPSTRMVLFAPMTCLIRKCLSTTNEMLPFEIEQAPRFLARRSHRQRHLRVVALSTPRLSASHPCS